MITKRIKSFTFAEVLITLVIIGVIAALTIPNLMQKYTEQTTVKKVQKFYSNLSNAYSLAIKDNGPASEWGLISSENSSSEKIYKMIFKPYFKIAKNCGPNNTGNCVSPNGYKLLNGSGSSYYGADTYYYELLLDDGAAIIIRGGEGYADGSVFYDVNGTKEPNQWGRDLFDFKIINNKIVPDGIPTGDYSYTPNSFNVTCNKTGAGYGCAAWIIYKGNMDYLHCNLTWDKNSCKDN